MPVTLITVLAASLLAAPHRATPSTFSIPPNGRVTTPEGVIFQLPPGFSYSVHRKNGQRTYAAVREKDTTAVTVSAFLSDAQLPCDPGVQQGVTVTSLETARGLRACSIDAGSEDSKLTMSLIYVKSGETFVAVSVIAQSTDGARRLAATVANSIEIDTRRSHTALTRVEVPRADPRMIGCFEESSGYSSMSGSFARRVATRCFHEDFTMTQRSSAMVSTQFENAGRPAGAAGAVHEGAETGGLWLFRNGRLSVRYDDGTAADWEITFGDTGLLANDRLWERF